MVTRKKNGETIRIQEKCRSCNGRGTVTNPDDDPPN